MMYTTSKCCPICI